MISMSIDAVRSAAAIKDMDAVLKTELRKKVQRATFTVHRAVVTKRLTGKTGPGRVAVRSGRLRSSVTGRVKDSGGVLTGHIGTPVKYAKVHDSLTPTVIRPVNAKWLAIPVGAGKTKAGVARGRAGVIGKGGLRFKKQVTIPGRGVFRKEGKVQTPIVQRILGEAVTIATRAGNDG